MNLAQLKERLLAEGYGPLDGTAPLIDEIGPRRITINDFRIEELDGQFRVTEVERGQVIHTHLATHDESAACRYFYDRVSNTMLHLKSFKDPAGADMLEKALGVAGIRVWRNDIPHLNGPNDPRYRVFVAGRDLLRAQQIEIQVRG